MLLFLDRSMLKKGSRRPRPSSASSCTCTQQKEEAGNLRCGTRETEALVDDYDQYAALSLSSTSSSLSSSHSHRPRAGSSTEETDCHLDFCGGGPLSKSTTDDFQVVPIEESESPCSHRTRWCALPGEKLSVRSIFYKRNRRKVPSLGELYGCVKVDFIESSRRIVDMSSRVELPDVDMAENGYSLSSNNNKTWHAPDIFVVTLSLPSDPNGGQDDGPSYTICAYFVMKKETREILSRITAPDYKENNDTAVHPHSAAVRLFNEWCKESPTDPAFQSRFKLIPSIQNMSDLGLPSWITMWNGKPLLIKRTGKTGFLYQHEQCMEMEISFHPFPWATKKGIQYLREHLLHKLLLTFGFVIEGRHESELPETLIGLFQLCFPRSENSIPADEFFASNLVKLRTLYTGEWPEDAVPNGLTVTYHEWDEDNG